MLLLSDDLTIAADHGGIGSRLGRGIFLRHGDGGICLSDILELWPDGLRSIGCCRLLNL